MIVFAPQSVLDRIIDRYIEENVRDIFRWVLELDACRLDRRNRFGCPCGDEEPYGNA